MQQLWKIRDNGTRTNNSLCIASYIDSSNAFKIDQEVIAFDS